jgi:hypothetical protein
MKALFSKLDSFGSFRDNSKWFGISSLLIAVTVSATGCGKDEVPKQSRVSIRRTIIKPGSAAEAQSATTTSGAEAALLKAFTSTLHPLVVANCSGCHATRVAPYFADPDAVKAFLAITGGKKVDFTTPTNSRLFQRLSIEGHNCWSSCPENSGEILKKIEEWIQTAGVTAGEQTKYAFVTPEISKPDMFKKFGAAATPSPAPGATPMPVAPISIVVEAESLALPQGWSAVKQPKSSANPNEFSYVTAIQGGNEYTVEEIDTAKDVAEFSILFITPEAGNYSLYIRAAGIANSENDFFYRAEDDKAWSIGKIDASGNYDFTRFIQKDNWPAGPHVIRIRQRSANIRIDKFMAATRGPDNGQILRNLTGLSLVPEALSSRYMSFNISGMTGVPNSQFLMMAEQITEKAYLFTQPFILMGDSSKAFKVNGVRPLINGVFTPQHTHWLGLEFFIKAPFSALTSIGLPLVAGKGPAEDKFSFAFDRIEPWDPATVPIRPK